MLLKIINRRILKGIFLGLACSFLFLGTSTSYVSAKEQLPQALKIVGVDEKLGEKIPLDLLFYDDNGNEVVLGDLIKNKPVILSMVYYTCPMLCNLIVSGLTDSYKKLPMTAGKEFQSISISIDNRDTKESTKSFKENYLSKVQAIRPETKWNFLYDKKDNAKVLADALGYRYEFDKRTNEYAHSATVFILSPNGSISRYLYGIEYPPFNLRMSVIEAAENKTHSTVERLLLFCYNYDPNSGGYVLYAFNLMKIAAFITVVGLTLMLIVLKRKEG